MPDTPRNYSIANDLPPSVTESNLDIGFLQVVIQNTSGITTQLNFISTDGDTLSIVFDAVLGAPEATILDGDTTNPAGGLLAVPGNLLSPIESQTFTHGFTNDSSISVVHNLDRSDILVQILIDGVSRDDLITAVEVAPADPTNECVITLSSAQTGDAIISIPQATPIALPSAQERLNLQNSFAAINGISVYDATGGQSFTGNTTINLDTTQTNTEGTLFSLASDVVTVAFDGVVYLSYELALGESGNRTESRSWIEVDTGGGFAAITGSQSWAYHRNTNQGSTTASGSFIINVSDGDSFRLRATRSSGGGTLVTQAQSARLTLLRIG